MIVLTGGKMFVLSEGKEYDMTPIVEAVEYGLDLCRFEDGRNAAKNMSEVRDSPLTSQFEQANALLAELRGAASEALEGRHD